MDLEKNFSLVEGSKPFQKEDRGEFSRLIYYSIGKNPGAGQFPSSAHGYLSWPIMMDIVELTLPNLGHLLLY